MRIRPNLLAAGAGIAVLLAVGVPAVASAQGGSTSSTTAAASGSASCPLRAAHQAVAAYLAAHPDVATEVAKIRALPRDQRPAARKAYLAQHPDVATAVHDLRASAGGDWVDVLAPVGDYLAAHPDVAALLDQLRSAPADQRKQIAENYLAAHPQTAGELRDAVKQLRQHARSCRTGGN
jgi:hemophore-related protein